MNKRAKLKFIWYNKERDREQQKRISELLCILKSVFSFD